MHDEKSKWLHPASIGSPTKILMGKYALANNKINKQQQQH